MTKQVELNFISFNNQMLSTPKKQPLRRQSSISSHGLSLLDTSLFHHPQPLLRAEIQYFNGKFSNLYNQIDGEDQPMNLVFNFITREVQKQEKSLKFDPQMISSRLKQLENKMQLGRAMLELDKRQSPRKAKTHRAHVPSSPSYKQVYQKELFKPIFQQIPQNRQESNDESDDPIKLEITEDIPHLHELKKRPKFLSYVLKKVRQPTIPKQEQTPVTLERQNSAEYLEAMKKLTKNRAGPNPQQIIEMQYPKFFSSQNTQSLSQQIREKPACRRLIDIHERYIDRSPQISDENRRKLQQKFNSIVRQIAKSDRSSRSKRSSATKLPKLNKSQFL